MSHGQPCPVDAGAQPCPVGAITQSCPVDAGAQPCPVGAITQSCPVDAGAQSCSVDAGTQSCPVDAGTQSCSVDAGTQSCSVDAVTQSCSVDTATQSCSVDAVTQSCSVDAVTQSCSVDPAQSVDPVAQPSVEIDSEGSVKSLVLSRAAPTRALLVGPDGQIEASIESIRNLHNTYVMMKDYDAFWRAHAPRFMQLWGNLLSHTIIWNSDPGKAQEYMRWGPVSGVTEPLWARKMDGLAPHTAWAEFIRLCKSLRISLFGLTLVTRDIVMEPLVHLCGSISFSERLDRGDPLEWPLSGGRVLNIRTANVRPRVCADMYTHVARFPRAVPETIALLQECRAMGQQKRRLSPGFMRRRFPHPWALMLKLTCGDKIAALYWFTFFAQACCTSSFQDAHPFLIGRPDCGFAILCDILSAAFGARVAVTDNRFVRPYVRADVEAPPSAALRLLRPPRSLVPVLPKQAYIGSYRPPAASHVHCYQVLPLMDYEDPDITGHIVIAPMNHRFLMMSKEEYKETTAYKDAVRYQRRHNLPTDDDSLMTEHFHNIAITAWCKLHAEAFAQACVAAYVNYIACYDMNTVFLPPSIMAVTQFVMRPAADVVREFLIAHPGDCKDATTAYVDFTVWVREHGWFVQPCSLSTFSTIVGVVEKTFPQKLVNDLLLYAS
jgi:hypothetical protein